jgi:hypothetical protein
VIGQAPALVAKWVNKIQQFLRPAEFAAPAQADDLVNSATC